MHPDAYEAPYDGVDSDCSGSDLTDVDGDGYHASSVGGLDCADRDASIHPGATEVAGDGVDSDCDGLDPEPELVSREFIIADTSSTFTETNHYRGNKYRMARDVMLEEFDVYLASSYDCSVEFYVHERATWWMPWDVVWSVSHSHMSGTGWYWSTYIDEWLWEDHEYILGVGWTCPTTYYAQYWEYVPDTAAFSYIGTAWDNSYSGYAGDFAPGVETSTGAAYHNA